MPLITGQNSTLSIHLCVKEGGMNKAMVLIAVVLWLIAGGHLYAQEGRLIGGPCSYDKIQGSCQITSVAKTDESIHQAQVSGGPGYEGNVIKYKFTPLDANQEYEKNKEYLLTLTNSWYPGDKFLDKYSIQEGKTFKCVMGRIVKGTCTPVVFEFPDINTSDYTDMER